MIYFSANLELAQTLISQYHNKYNCSTEVHKARCLVPICRANLL